MLGEVGFGSSYSEVGAAVGKYGHPPVPVGSGSTVGVSDPLKVTVTTAEVGGIRVLAPGSEGSTVPEAVGVGLKVMMMTVLVGGMRVGSVGRTVLLPPGGVEKIGMKVEGSVPVG